MHRVNMRVHLHGSILLQVLLHNKQNYRVNIFMSHTVQTLLAGSAVQQADVQCTARPEAAAGAAASSAVSVRHPNTLLGP